MKIVTYNVNSLRQRVTQFGSLLKLLNSLEADIICIQETKLSRQDLTADLTTAEGYEAFFSCTRTFEKGRVGYSGVATFCRVNSAFSSNEAALPVAAEEGFTGLLESSKTGDVIAGDFPVELNLVDEDTKNVTRQDIIKVDSEGRCIITDHGHFVLFNIYGPRADPDDKERTRFKYIFYKILQKRWESLFSKGKRVIVVGDFNIAPAALDRSGAGPDFEDNLFRKWMRSLLVKHGGPFVDAFRAKNPSREAYTCWSQCSGAEELNHGSRIDHILIGGPCLHESYQLEDHDILKCHVKECDILSEFKRWKPNSISRWNGGRTVRLEGSDHVPVYIFLQGIPDLPVHSLPSLAARYIPEVRGRQQTIVSLLQKRELQDEKNHCGSLFIGSESSELQNCGSDKPSHAFGLLVEQNRKESRLDVSGDIKKRRSRQGCSQPTLKSFLQKRKLSTDISFNIFDSQVSKANAELDSLGVTEEITAINESRVQKTEVGTNVTVDVSVSQVDRTTTEIDSVNEDNLQEDELEMKSCSQDQEGRQAYCSSEKDRSTTASLEWQRIQQLMQRSIPLCVGHSEPCVKRSVKKPGPNWGRGFYVCARAEGPPSNPEARCNHFQWASRTGKKKKK
ncbi:hypothetical protein H6P81_018460 [Aristolochia fimbriata]|uniref:DNA-(apurinic or apyrimidinic site) endonuclease 2 n=1 Tax=Aristolochia fimbriata TaxID=158543 RepID=A0AAV7E4C3_ARIFI|nr:hypothetical protein H6P81_018460 [Aristolochia fimbriata]